VAKQLAVPNQMTPPTAQSPHAYRENTVLAATPEQRVVMLYDGAKRFLRQALKAMDAHEIERAHNALRRVELIVAHLDTVLEYDHDRAFASRLHDLYRFCQNHMRRARMDQDPDKVEEVDRILEELRASWVQIAHG
jgi:flagellar protein FliS